MAELDTTRFEWRKSSHSGNQGGNCVEVRIRPGAVAVRDSTDRTGPVLHFPRAAWSHFLTSLSPLAPPPTL